MKASGRPLRFLGVAMGSWVVLRVAILMPEASVLPDADGRVGFPSFVPRLFGDRWGMPPGSVDVPRPARLPAPTAASGPSTAPLDVQLALLGRIGFGEPQRQARPLPIHPLLSPPLPQPAGSVPTALAAPAASRFSASGWLSVRGGDGSTLSPAGQLGGSQIGARLRYALGDARQFALSARVTSPLRGKGAETGLGIEWRPAASPVALLVEQRIGLDGTKGGPGITAIGGIDPTPIVGAVAIEGYGQAGGILRAGRVEPFADGALRVAAPVARMGSSVVTAGLGTWGGVQRDAARLDLGPSVAIAVPVGGQRFRFGLDWRQRVAGDARPDSGLAFSVGTDF